jgi:FADH2-dependent halogenase
MADVIIIGGGPAGAAAALYLLKTGVRPLVLEKAGFPRYHIGESMTGECGGCIRELGLEGQLLRDGHPIKHGTTVYGAGGNNSFWVPVAQRTPDGELRPNWVWQVLRSKFDQTLLETAIRRGAEFLPCEAVDPLVAANGRVTGVRVRTPRGNTEDVKAEVVIDASGQATFLANRGITSPKEQGNYDKQVAIFSQVTGAIRDPGEAGGNTLIFYQQKHHWAWFIPLDQEMVSIGVVVPSAYFTLQKLAKGDFLRQEMGTLNPELSSRVTDVTFVEEVRTASNYSYHVKQFTGPGFLCIGDSHRFTDPIFSLGLCLATNEAKFAAQAILQELGSQIQAPSNPFAAYQAMSEQGQDILQDLIDCFWDFPLAFQYMVNHRYKEDMIDCFAGRLYGDRISNSDGVKDMRRLLARGPAPHGAGLPRSANQRHTDL